MANKRDWRYDATLSILNIKQESEGILFGILGVTYGVPDKIVRESPGEVLEKVCEMYPRMLACAAERLLAIQQSETESEFMKRDAAVMENHASLHKLQH